MNVHPAFEYLHREAIHAITSSFRMTEAAHRVTFAMVNEGRIGCIFQYMTAFLGLENIGF